MSTNNNTTVYSIAKEIIFANVKIRIIESNNSKDSYPEIRQYSKTGKVNTPAVKEFLYVNGLLSEENYNNPKCDFEPISYGLYLAFKTGKLSLNATKQFGVINFTPIRLSTSMGGKMKDVWAISTLSLVNPMCLRRMKIKDIVCEHCYVKRSLHITAILNYIQNFFILSSCVIPVEFIPVLNIKQARKVYAPDDIEKKNNINAEPLVRLESMGDLANTIQAENYLRISNANAADNFKFALWTKNPNYLKQAVDNMGKPENLSTVWSMSRVNVMDANPDKYNSYFNHRFIVVRGQELKDKYLAKNGFYPCKCGPRSCVFCRECYTNTETIETAVELLREN